MSNIGLPTYTQNHLFTETVQKFKFLKKTVHLVLAISLEKVSTVEPVLKTTYVKRLPFQTPKDSFVAVIHLSLETTFKYSNHIL